MIFSKVFSDDYYSNDWRHFVALVTKIWSLVTLFSGIFAATVGLVGLWSALTDKVKPFSSTTEVLAVIICCMAVFAGHIIDYFVEVLSARSITDKKVEGIVACKSVNNGILTIHVIPDDQPAIAVALKSSDDERVAKIFTNTRESEKIPLIKQTVLNRNGRIVSEKYFLAH